jgi:DNA anti-recombination protein RmuC
MRARLVFILVAILLVAGFAALNWSEFNRTAPLSFGVLMTDAPLGVVMLTLLGITLAIFLVSSAAQESRHMMEHRRQSRDLQAQRDLAEKAEASRITDLRQHLDTHLRESRQREAIAATEFEKAMVQSQRELRAQLDQMNHTLATRLDELTGRLGPRTERVERVDAEPVVTDVKGNDRVRL